MTTVHITPSIYFMGKTRPALCGAYASPGADKEIGPITYGSGWRLNSSEKWCTLCQERFPMWELGSTDL